MEPTEANTTDHADPVTKNIADALRGLKDYVEAFVKQFGSEVKSPADIEGRMSMLDILRAQHDVIKSIGHMLDEAEARECERIDHFISEQERLFASMRGALNHGKEKPEAPEKHVELSSPADTQEDTASKNNNKPVQKTQADQHIALKASGKNDKTGKQAVPVTPAPMVSDSSDSDTRDYIGAWAEVAKGGKPVTKQNDPRVIMKNAAGPTTTGQPARKVVAKDVAPATSLFCVEVDTVAGCHQNLGRICYAKREETFCLSVNGMMINLGPKLPTIFDANQTHKKNQIHQPLKPGQRVDPAASDFFVPLNHSTGKADQANLSNRTVYVPARFGEDPRRYNYCTRLGDAEQYRDDVRDLHEDHPDFIYFENIAACNFLTLITTREEFNRRKTKK